MQKYCPGIPFILVGTKTDLRDDENSNDEVISHEEGEAKAKELGVPYIEVSSKLQRNLDVLFDEAARVGLKMNENHEEEKQKCIVQ